MKKRKLWWALVVASVFLTVGCPGGTDTIQPPQTGQEDDGKKPDNKPEDTNKPDIPILDADKTVGSEGLTDTNLDRKTVTVTAGTTLKNLKNGNIVIDGSVGKGTVKIEGGSGLSVTVKSNANIVLSSDTELESLIITKDAKKATVTSTKSIAARAARAAGESANVTGEDEPDIIMLQVEAEADLILEGGNVKDVVACSDGEEKADIIITRDSTATIRTMLHADKDGNEIEGLNLELEQDESYDKKGVKVNISGISDDAKMLQVFRIKAETEWMSIIWAEDSIWNEKEIRDKVKADSFEYEYLNKDEKYHLVFKYYKPLWIDQNGNFSDEKILLSSDVVEVTPTKAGSRELAINDGEFKVDAKTGDIEWITEPDVPAKPGAKVSYGVYSGDWIWIGGYDISVKSDNLFEKLNLYSDFSISRLEKIEDDKVFISADYTYDGFSWKIFDTEPFDFHKEFYPDVELADNIITFKNSPNTKVVPKDAAGFYLWLYSGEKGSYAAYTGIPQKDKYIDLNLVIETNPELKAAIKDDDNQYSYDLAWFKAVEKLAPDGKTKIIDNEYISSFSHVDNKPYVEQSGYEPAVVTLSANKLNITKPGAKMFDEYKQIGTNIGIDIHAGDEDIPWYDPKLFPSMNIALADIAKGNVEIDLAKYLGLAAESIKKNGNKYSVSVWVKDDEGNWKSQVCTDIAGTFDTTGYDLPTLKFENGKIRITKPGTKLAQYLKGIGFPYYYLQIRDINTAVEGYDWANDKSYLFSFTEYTVDGTTATDQYDDGSNYTIGALPEELDLIDLVLESDLTKVKDNTVWIGLATWDKGKTGGWCSSGGVDLIEVTVDLQGYDKPKLTPKADNILQVTTPGEKYTQYMKNLGAVKYKLTVRNVDCDAEGYWDDPDGGKDGNDYNNHVLIEKDYPLESLPQQIDLNLLAVESDRFDKDKIKDGKIWIELVLENGKEWDDTNFKSWKVISSTEFAFDTSVLTSGYKPLMYTINAEPAEEDGYSTITVTRPGEKLIEAYKANGADSIVFEIWTYDDEVDKEYQWCGWATFVFDEADSDKGVYLDPKAPITTTLNTSNGYNAEEELEKHGNWFILTVKSKKVAADKVVDEIFPEKWYESTKLTLNPVDLSNWKPTED